MWPPSQRLLPSLREEDDRQQKERQKEVKRAQAGTQSRRVSVRAELDAPDNPGDCDDATPAVDTPVNDFDVEEALRAQTREKEYAEMLRAQAEEETARAQALEAERVRLRVEDRERRRRAKEVCVCANHAGLLGV